MFLWWVSVTISIAKAYASVCFHLIRFSRERGGGKEALMVSLFVCFFSTAKMKQQQESTIVVGWSG
jgi:hypothetical protein